MDWEALADRVAEVQGKLGEVHDALRKEGYSSGFNYERGFHDFDTPGLTLVNVSRWLAAEALAHGKAGRKEQSFRPLESLTRLVRLLGDEPREARWAATIRAGFCFPHGPSSVWR